MMGRYREVRFDILPFAGRALELVPVVDSRSLAELVTARSRRTADSPLREGTRGWCWSITTSGTLRST